MGKDASPRLYLAFRKPLLQEPPGDRWCLVVLLLATQSPHGTHRIRPIPTASVQVRIKCPDLTHVELLLTTTDPHNTD